VTGTRALRPPHINADRELSDAAERQARRAAEGKPQRWWPEHRVPTPESFDENQSTGPVPAAQHVNAARKLNTLSPVDRVREPIL
jgi:hypothetical protein